MSTPGDAGVATNVGDFINLIREAERRDLIPFVVVIPVAPAFLDGSDLAEVGLGDLAAKAVRGAIRGRRERQARDEGAE